MRIQLILNQNTPLRSKKKCSKTSPFLQYLDLLSKWQSASRAAFIQNAFLVIVFPVPRTVK